jgi:hypothetical protein
VLGKLLVYLGEDRILWGTDSIFYGTPQDQIQAMRAFQITRAFQDQHGYPALDGLRKRKIFGLNAAALYGVEPRKRGFSFTPAEMTEIRETFPEGNHTWGPRSPTEMAQFHDLHRGWP